ncbi:MAG: GNAT family protein [Planctomycetota bacterium]
MSLIIPVDGEISLRLVAPEHAEEIVPVVRANIGYVGKWLPWCTDAYDVEGCREWAKASLRGFGERRQLPLSVLENGRVVGGCGWTDWRQEHRPDWNLMASSADIGYWLAEDVAGRGIMTRCVARLLDYAFSEVGLDRVTIRAEPDNRRSCGVPERLGFTHEGTLRHIARWGDRWVDHRLYAILREDWRGLTSD